MKLKALRKHLKKLSGAYIASGKTHADRNQAYARRIAVTYDDWAKYYPDYIMTKKNSPTVVDVYPNLILRKDHQRASDHNGFAHEWHSPQINAFDAIYDSPVLAQLSKEKGYDVRAHISDNFFGNCGDFLAYHVPVENAIRSNLSGPFINLARVAAIMGREDYIAWVDEYVIQTVRKKLRRDGFLSEGMGYSLSYLGNKYAAMRTRDYFLSYPAKTPGMKAIRDRATSFSNSFDDGEQGFKDIAMPNGMLPAHGDTKFHKFGSMRGTGHSVVLPAYGALAIGAGSDLDSAVQLNQIFAGDGNHMRSDTTSYTLWAFGNEYIGNVRYLNHSLGRPFTEQILAYNAVTIDRSDMASPHADTYGNGDLTIFEPGVNGLAVTELDGQRAYENKASRYQRIMMLNTHDIAKPYVLDIMRVAGGTKHDYTFHGSIMYAQTWKCSASLKPSSLKRPLLEKGEKWAYPTKENGQFPYYGMWEKVSSKKVTGGFQITYQDTSAANRDIRLWMTNKGTSEVFVGETPVPVRGGNEGKPITWWDNDNWRPSAIIRNEIPSGTLDSLFVSVMEPMNNGVSVIKKVERLPMKGNALDSCAVRITFTDGRVDTCVVNLHNPGVAGASAGSSTVSTTDGHYVLNGRIGVLCNNKSNSRAWSIGAADFKFGKKRLSSTAPSHSGTISSETRKLAGGANNAFITSTKLPLGTVLQGEHLSLTFGALSVKKQKPRTGISEMFIIDKVLLIDGQYHICFVQDHQLEISSDGSVATEQRAPLRTFKGACKFEIVRATTARQSFGIIKEYTYETQIKTRLD